MNEETATIRYKVYVEKRVYVNHGDDDNSAADKIHDQMWTLKEDYMDAKPLDFDDVKIIDRGY